MSAVESIPYQSLGRPIRGPRALTHDWARFWHLSFNIAVLQWKLRFFGSALGYVWPLVRPLLMFGVLWVFFTKIGHIGQGPSAAPGKPEHFYGAQLLGGIVLFTFFSVATGGAVQERSGERRPRPQDPVPEAGDSDVRGPPGRSSTSR